MIRATPPGGDDAIVIGGSYAGMTAALQLARARRRVRVIDAGRRRNRFAAYSHGFLTQDGRSPDEIAAQGREQLLAYPAVHWLDASANSAVVDGEGFRVGIESGEVFEARRLVLAPGVVDELPPVEGVAERWGRSVFHCPYCHGYELQQGRIGVLAAGPMSQHQAALLPDWGQVTLFAPEGMLEAAQVAGLAARGVVLEHARVVRVVEYATVELADGRAVSLDGLFVAPRTRVATPLAAQLGCLLEEGPLGAFIQVDAMQETSVRGVFACGDAARAVGNVALAVGSGAFAGVAAHQSLVFR